MIFVHAYHFKGQYFNKALLVESDIFRSECWVWPSFDSDHLADSEDAGAEDGPYLFLVEHFALLISLFDLFFEGMFEVLIDEGDFIEGGAEGILQFGVGSFEVEDVLVFLW